MRAAIYTRISSDPSGREAGVKRQESDCRELVVSNGWDLAGVWTDNDRSATDRRKRREAFDDLLRNIQSGAIDAIVVWHVDRLYRKPRELEDLVDYVEDGRLPGGIHTVTAGDIDLSTASGRLIAGVLVQVSKHEVDRTRERLAAMNRHAAAAGKRVGGRRAFGYEKDGFTVRESEAVVWSEMADRVNDGASIRGLASELRQRGVLTAGGNPFSPSRLRDILLNPRYVGLRTYKGEIVADADWPPLIDRARWEKLQAILNDPARKTTPGPAPKHLLPGFIYCGICGDRLATRTQHKQRAYGCKPTSSGGCGGISVMAAPIEGQVVEWLFDALDDPRLSAALVEYESVSNDENLATEITDLEARLDDLAAAYADGEITRRQLAKASEKLMSRLESLRARIAPRSSVLATIDGLQTARELWEQEGLEFRRALVAAVIDRIVVNPATRGWNFHDPERVKIHPKV